LQCLDRGARVGCADRRQRRGRLAGGWRGSGDEDHLSILALGLGQKIGERRLSRRPVMRRRPAVVDDNQNRAGRLQSRLRVEQRMGSCDNHQRGERDAQQDQP